jgi:phosphoglycerol transferase MdoB-like AlkP superfamily enzyme
MRVGLVAVFHVAALGLMLWTEHAPEQKAAFLLTWGLLNFFWLALTRRPGVSAALSLAMISLLILLSVLKYKVLWMTVDFVDLMIIDPDSVAFLFSIFPNLGWMTLLAAAVVVPTLVLLWWFDIFRVPRVAAIAGSVSCLAALVGLSFAIPSEPFQTFYGNNYVSHFARSGVEAVYEFMTHGYMEADASVADRLRLVPEATCQPAKKPPHIIMVHDESSFDIRNAPGVKVPPGYAQYFRSFDGKARNFVVEGAGGPSWYTEYNVLSGLSARTFGRFSYFVTRLAAGRVVRGLPNALKRCGYQTFSLYPALGAFMSAKSYQTTTGVQRFVDQTGMGTNRIEADRFYYDAAAKMIERQHSKGPMFVFVYLAANHWPWNYRWRPELAPQWKDIGNRGDVDEYLRRQTMGMQDYADFLARLKRDFPQESFLLVRYGDHQPDFASLIIDPSLDEAGIAERIRMFDPRYFTTYYALDTVNFKPVNVTSALDTLEGPYLPLVLQEAAGLPLDASFAEQKRILERCHGLFYACAGGAEARRFNRLLIDAGLIKGL